LGLYRCLRLGVPVDQSFDVMRTVWTPDNVWTEFIESMLAKHGG
jgi:hypothetical protein